MQSLSEIRLLLEARGLAPRKALGQNFLIDHNLIRKLVDAAQVTASDTILEVGPGTGTLTEELLARGSRVIAAELDTSLAALLRERFAPMGDRFTLIEGDCLAGKRALAPAIVTALAGQPFKLVANLPYGAATPVMSTILTDYPQCPGLYVTIQREVADRLLAQPGTKEFGTLTVIANAAATGRLVATLPPECFWPRPDVTSAMLSLTRRPQPLFHDLRALADFTQKLFEKRRKQLGAILGRDREWPPGVAPSDRAESLTVPQLIELYQSSRGP